MSDSLALCNLVQSNPVLGLGGGGLTVTKLCHLETVQQHICRAESIIAAECTMVKAAIDCARASSMYCVEACLGRH